MNIIGDDMRLLIFGIPKCIHCKEMFKTMQQTSKFPIAKINIYKSPELALKYGIAAYPTVILIRDDFTIDTLIGNVPQKVYKIWLKANTSDWFKENNID